MGKTKLILTLCCISSILFGQQYYSHYTTANGLPHDITYGIFQDDKDIIWIGTDNGLAKFDGQDFTIFNTDNGLRTNYIIDIDEDDKGNLYLASWGGGVHIIRNDSVVIPEIMNDSLEKLNNISVLNDTVLVENSRGNYLYVKNGKTYNRNNYVIYKNENNSYVLKEPDPHERPNGKLSFLDNEMIVYNGSFHLPNKVEKLRGIYRVVDYNKLVRTFPFFKNTIVQSVTKLSDKNYVATQKDTLFFFNNHRITLETTAAIEDRIIEKIIPISADMLLVLAKDYNGFKKAYLHEISKNETSDFSKIIQTKSPISDILKDHEGNLWFTTHGDGVYCFYKNDIPISFLNENALPEVNIKGIVELKKKIYVLTPNHLTSLVDLKRDQVFNLKGISKQLIKLNDKEIAVNFLGEEEKDRNSFLKKTAAYRTFKVDSIGVIIHADSLEIPSLKTSIEENRTLLDAVFFKDTLWFATSTGPSYYDYQTKTLKDKSINGKTLASKQIKQFVKRNDSLWVATTKGLHLLNKNEIKRYQTKDGLVDDHINTMLVDHRNHLWIGTQKGVSVFNGTNFANITENTGLLSPYVEVLFEDSRNKVWIGGNKGISLINNQKPLKLQSAPSIVSSQNNTSFDYTIISYNRPNALLAEFKIDENKWTAIENAKGKLHFDTLNSGKHRFKLRAKKQDGVWGYTPAYTFNVTLPWYKQWLYVFALVTTMLALVTFFVMKRLRQIKKRNLVLQQAIENQQKLESELNHVRENIAQDFHDDLGNKLARISLLSNLINKEVSNDNRKLSTKVKQINADANDLYLGTRDFIFSLKSNSDYIEELVTYLSDFGEDFYSKTRIRFVLENKINQNIRLPYYWSKQLIYIFKETMTNTLKHSACTEVRLTFTYEKNTLSICCTDNGIGITADEMNSNNGILNMKKRAEKIGCQLVITSEEKKGTTVSFIGKTA
ncbi:two-component regulator propeller domain-containing protein [Spongiivirga sp. MCCC 1A20706]|uniref:ligand-binding sensor domain-containing protein n=1 Tax=Spongiivirga sp. MCCC 1A20706 TaxID=3160963 RepID=UPI0039774AE6